MTDKNINENDQTNKDEKLTDAEKKRELEDLFKDFMAVIFEEDRKENGETIEDESEEDSEDENKE